MPSASSCGVRLGIPVFDKLVDGIRFVGPDGTSGGKYSKVSFVRRPWGLIITTPLIRTASVQFFLWIIFGKQRWVTSGERRRSSETIEQARQLGKES
jgi:hypothetical protein